MLLFFVFFYLLLNLSSISSEIELVNVRENVNVTITCRLNATTSNSENILLWYKDQTQVIGVNGISNNPKNYLLNRVNQLTIISVQLESVGVYKCQSFTTKEEQQFQLRVLVPPSHLDLVPSLPLPAIDGSRLDFNCSSKRVYPNPIFEWYQNDKLLQRSIGNQTFFSSWSIFTLSLTPADHNHILRCQVSNEASIDKTSLEIKLEILFKPRIKMFYHDKELNTDSLTVIENSFDSVRCRITANPSTSESDIQWYKNEQLILGANQEQLEMNFTGIKQLSCRARNAIGQSEESIQIHLLYRPKLSMIEHRSLRQGEKLVLTCSIDSNPWCDRVRWLFDNQELRSQPCTTRNQSEFIVEHIDRSQAGKYSCEVRNRFDNHSDGISQVSTDVRVQYAPLILNTYQRLAVMENEDIRTECLVDGYPKPEIKWTGPSGRILDSFTEERALNNTVQVSILHLPSSFSSILGSYRCTAKNNLGHDEFSIQFQRPGLPDPPLHIEILNITHSSFILNWQSGYDGGSEQIFQIHLNSTPIEERYTNLNSIRFDDLNENTRYMLRIRAKNEFGYSDYSNNVVLRTKISPIRSEDFPSIEHVYHSKDTHRIRFQLNSLRGLDRFCLRYYNLDEISSCIPLNSMDLLNQGLNMNMEHTNVRLKLCLINQTDICSKSFLIPTTIPLVNYSSDWMFIIAGGLIGLCIVVALIILFLCFHQRRQKKRAKNGSLDTLKTNSDQCHSIPSVRVSDTSSSVTYPRNQPRTIYYNDETTGVYSIQEKKKSFCFDSGMPSITSTNSDSLTSQALSISDFYDRSDGEHLVNGRIPPYTLNPMHANGRISSEEESGFCTPTKTHQGKKLVYEVVV